MKNPLSFDPKLFRALACAVLPGLCPVMAAAVSFDCLMEPLKVVEVGSPVSGLIDRVTVRRADRVLRGQVIATLESRAEAAAAELARFKSQATGPMETATSKIEFSKKKFDRRKEMAAEKLMARQEADDAEAELRLARAELTSVTEARQQAAIEYRQQASLLELRTVRSPVNGVVVDQMLHPGEVVEPGGRKPIFKLAQIDPLKVRVVMPMAVFGKPKIGMKVEVAPESPVGGKHVGTVVAVDRLLDAASGTFIAFLHLPNPGYAIPAGAKCKADFQL